MSQYQKWNCTSARSGTLLVLLVGLSQYLKWNYLLYSRGVGHA